MSLPLDLTPIVNCKAAFSLYRVNTLYTGATVNVRRSIDNVTQDFYSNFSGKLGTQIDGQGTSIESWLGNSTGYVTIWYDQSGKGNNAIQTTQTSQPILGKKSIDFRTSRFFNLPNGTVPQNSPYTVTVKHNDIASSGCWLGAGYTNVNQSNQFRRNFDGYLNYWYGNDFAGNYNTYNKGNTVTFAYDGSYSYLYINGTEQGISPDRSTSGWNGQATDDRFGGNSYGGEFIDGEIYFLYIFDSYLSHNERTSIESNIGLSGPYSGSVSLSSLRHLTGKNNMNSFKNMVGTQSNIKLSDLYNFKLKNGLFTRFLARTYTGPTIFESYSPDISGVTTNLKDTFSTTCGLYKTNNIISNGSFSGGNGIPGEGDSNPTNVIIQLENPGDSPYVLQQNGSYTEYQLNYSNQLLPNRKYVMSGWYSKSSDYNGADTMFHARAYSNSGNHIVTEMGLFNILETRVVGSLTWYFCYAVIETPSDYSYFNWYVGYGANNTIGYRYYTKLSLSRMDPISQELYGLFYAPVSGTYTFYMSNNDSSYFWLGNNALSGYTISNSNINNSSGYSRLSCTSYLNGGEYYPIRIHASISEFFNFGFSLPNGKKVYEGTGYFFCPGIEGGRYLLHYKFNSGDEVGTSIANWKDGTKSYNPVSTLYNGATISTSSFKTGTASLYLNKNLGIQYVQTPNFTPTTNGLTFSVWYNSDTSNTWARIFDFGNGAAVDNVGISTNGGSNDLAFFCVPGDNFNLNDINYNDGQWRHVTWTLTYSPEGSSTSTWTIYINGQLKTTLTGRVYPKVVTRTLCYIGKSNWDDGAYNGYIDDFRVYNKVLSSSEISNLESNDLYFIKTGNSYITTLPHGITYSKPATSGFAIYSSNPWLPNGYYWIQSSTMPNPVKMYVDIKNGGFDFHQITGGISVNNPSSSHTGTPLGLDLIIPRSKDHWKAIYNYVYNVLGTTYSNTLSTINIYKTTNGGNYTGYAMYDPRFGNNGSYNGAPDWIAKDGGLWYIKDVPFGEPNGDYSANTFLGTYSIETYPQWLTSYGSPGFNDITSGYYTGSNYIVSTNYTGFSIDTMLNNYLDGSSAFRAAPSAQYIKKLTGTNTNGIYWIDLPTVGPTQIYCIMDSTIDGGGWMMAMKSTTGATFSYSSSHWTSVTTLNENELSRNNGDSKYHTMNYFNAKDILALWPDIPYNYNGGSGGNLSLSSYNNWCWLKNNFNSGTRQTLINLFSTVNNLSLGEPRGAERGTAFSSQVGNSFYGINFTAFPDTNVRWGLAWNNEWDWYSNDVIGGIGMYVIRNGVDNSRSAGDWIGCCQDQIGINRTARVEMYIR